ncbi:MAG TPA: efflux transporter outer membrane subunit [Usitatibacteraceae bacterium]
MIKLPMRSLASIAVVTTLAGCAVGPDYKRPALELPQTWPATPAGAAAVAGDNARWWTIYGDGRLNTLVDEALHNNTDLAVAVARLAEAEAQLGIVRSDQFPSVYGTAERSRDRATGAGSFTQPGVPLQTTTNRVALNVSYEIDFWGKYRRATEAARAELLASEAARDTVRISLAAQVATAYFNLVALDQRLDATRLAVQRSKESLDMQKVRFDAGVVSSFEYQQRLAEHEANLAQLPPVERDRAATERALAVLLGRSPRAVIDAQIERSKADAMATADTGAQVALAVPAGLPSDLLLRRPDLREAEQKLIASNARIGVARAAYFPSISLTGLLGSESASLSNLFTGPARIWHFAGDLTQPIWTAGSVGSQVAVARARNEQTLAQYRNTIANAFREVQDAVSAQAKAREIFDAESRRVSALNQSYSLAKLRFASGVASQLEVIDNERSLINAELNRIEAERAFRAAVADLFRAMGGSSVAPAKG